MMRPLNQPLNLRTTADWPGYKEIRPVPIGFGRVTMNPYQYNQQRTEWALSGREILSVVEVKIDDKATQNWSVRTAADPRGNPITLLTTAQLSEEQKIVVTYDGLPSPRTGSLLTNPGEWLHYVLTQLIGIDIPLARFNRFATECLRRNIEINLLLDDNTRSARSVILDVLESAGALFALNSGSVGLLWPPTPQYITEEPIQAVLDATKGGIDAEWSAVLDDIVNEQTINYNFDYSTNENRSSITVRAVKSVEKYGRYPASRSARGARSARQSLRLAERLLRWYSGPLWEGRLTVQNAPPKALPGSVITYTDPTSPVQGEFVVFDAETDPLGLSGQLRMYSPAPLEFEEYRVVQQTERFDDLNIQFVVKRENDVVTIVAADRDNVPIPGAFVTLAGITRQANEAGLATFTGISPGTYELVIEAANFDTLTIPEYQIR